MIGFAARALEGEGGQVKAVLEGPRKPERSRF